MNRVLIADDHPLFRDALRQLFEGHEDDFEVLEAGTLDAAKALVESDQEIDLVLLDVYMPGADGFSGLLELRNLSPATPIIIISGSVDARTVDKAITCGAAGCVPKTIPRETIVAAVETVLAGGIYRPDDSAMGVALDEPRAMVGSREIEQRLSTLTPAEGRVLKLLVDGKPNKIIAAELDVKESTVKAHISAILRKLAVFSRTQAVLMVRDLNYGG